LRAKAFAFTLRFGLRSLAKTEVDRRKQLIQSKAEGLALYFSSVSCVLYLPLSRSKHIASQDILRHASDFHGRPFQVLGAPERRPNGNKVNQVQIEEK